MTSNLPTLRVQLQEWTEERDRVARVLSSTGTWLTIWGLLAGFGVFVLLVGFVLSFILLAGFGFLTLVVGGAFGAGVFVQRRSLNSRHEEIVNYVRQLRYQIAEMESVKTAV